MKREVAQAGLKDVLLSIKPTYANLIVDGIKTIELRRKFPENLPAGTKLLVYSTAPEKVVIGDCEIREVLKLTLTELWSCAGIEAMISKQDFERYFDGLDEGYGIKLWKYRRYKTPKLLTSYFGKNAVAPQSYRYLPGAQA